jgi:NAD(P)-dependent dehydrogenase (short-subunit alcohol dehydrogenase family)
LRRKQLVDLELSGRNVLITGGSRGIGAVIAAAFVKEGAKVAIGARTRSDLDATAAGIRAETPGATVSPVTLDVTDSDSVGGAVRAAIEALGHIDIAVNCAVDVVGGAPGAASKITTEALADGIDVKVLGALRIMQAVLPAMREHGWGRIISLGGGAARQIGSLSAGVRNSGLVAITKNIASEVGSHGITANVIHPGGVLTERNQPQLSAAAERDGISLREAEANMAASVPIGRMVHPDDIANLALFLSSPHAAAITGQAIGVGGGGTRTISY